MIYEGDGYTVDKDIIKTFEFDGKTTADFGVEVSDDADWWKTAQPDIQHVEVPGRNGDLIIPNNRYKNLPVTFKVNRINDGTGIAALQRWLGRHVGYYKLTDSGDLDHYRMASFESSLAPTFTQMKHESMLSIPFSCKPQRFLNSGDEPVYIIPYAYGASYKTFTMTAADPTATPWVTATMHFLDENLTTITGTAYFSGGGASETKTFSFTDGQTLTFTPVNAQTDWKLEFDEITYPYYVEISAAVTVDGTDYELENALFGCPDVPIENPTGYATRPLLRFLGGNDIPRTNIDATETNSDESGFSLVFSSISSTDIFMDCETQYVYYYTTQTSSSGIVRKVAVNVTDKLTLVDDTVGWGSTRFPSMGEVETTIEIGIDETDGESETGCPHLMAVYPRWWEL